MDVMMKVYDALMADEYIAAQAGGRIKFYDYPATLNFAGPAIIIDPISTELDTDFADDKPIAEEYLYQIDVWTTNRKQTKELARRVKDALRAVNFYYNGSGVDEYDKDSKIYRDARRFRGKVYSEDVKALS